MQPMAVDLRVLRALLTPDIKIVPGRAMMARVVVADGSGKGSLSIAGYLLEAELPKEVRAGQDLRLVVRDVSAERVLLGIADQHEAPAQQTQAPVAPPPAVPLPGGGTLQVTERDAQGGPAGSPDSHTLTLRYDAPALGAVDLRFELDPGALRLGVTVSPRALAAAQGDADDLRQALADELHRAISVVISPRREPLDVYA
ncbi:MAG TPA: hypothetical protein VHX62_04510 [Solirubrobacteraceae bacterium]|jgi:hypothetical protein|nr:hypothetical protein [Solirubrobacteraceae bacterium]